MKVLSKNLNIDFDEDYFFSKQDILNLYRLQKQLLIEENIIASLLECANIWQRYSSDLAASWLFFPDEDDAILRCVKSSDFFTNFEEYSQS